MRSYWFICYTTEYINIDGKLVRVAGNAVLEIESESFLPGTAIHIMQKSCSEGVTDNSDKLGMHIKIVSLLQISEEGYKNFDSPDIDKINFSYKNSFRNSWSDDVHVNVV